MMEFYFQKLLNDENECEFEVEGAVEVPLNIINREEVEGALRGMKNGKAAGPSGMMSDLLKFGNDRGVGIVEGVPGNYGRGTCRR